MKLTQTTKSFKVCKSPKMSISGRIKQHKGCILQFGLFVLIVCYTTIGGIIFILLESEAHQEKHQNLLSTMRNCSRTAEEQTLVVTLCVEPHLQYPKWTYTDATLFAFTIMATEGYGQHAPITSGGRLFCVFFALFGIPLCMLFFANIGVNIKNLSILILNKIQRKNDANSELSSKNLLFLFLTYVTFGAVLLLIFQLNQGFLDSFYYTFTGLTGGDFRNLAQGSAIFLPFKLIYASIGLSFSMMAIDKGSEYLKKLHYFGKKLKNAAHCWVWFGSKKVTVRTLAYAVAYKCAIDPSVINMLDIEELAQCAICIEDGTLKPRQSFGPEITFKIDYADDDEWFAETEYDPFFSLELPVVSEERTNNIVSVSVENEVTHEELITVEQNIEEQSPLYSEDKRDSSSESLQENANSSECEQEQHDMIPTSESSEVSEKENTSLEECHSTIENTNDQGLQSPIPDSLETETVQILFQISDKVDVSVEESVVSLSPRTSIASEPAGMVTSKINKVRRFSYIDKAAAIQSVAMVEPGRTKHRHDPRKRHENYQKEWQRIQDLLERKRSSGNRKSSMTNITMKKP